MNSTTDRLFKLPSDLVGRVTATEFSQLAMLKEGGDPKRYMHAYLQVLHRVAEEDYKLLVSSYPHYVHCSLISDIHENQGDKAMIKAIEQHEKWLAANIKGKYLAFSMEACGSLKHTSNGVFFVNAADAMLFKLART